MILINKDNYIFIILLFQITGKIFLDFTIWNLNFPFLLFHILGHLKK